MNYLNGHYDDFGISNILDAAYPSGLLSSLEEEGASDLLEKIASNAEIREWFNDKGKDYNKHTFIRWKELLKNKPMFNMPDLDSDYIRNYSLHIQNDAKDAYNWRTKWSGKNSRKLRKLTRKQITDEVNQKIRKALSTVAYNQSLNNDSPLYAKSGGILSKNRLLPRRRFNNL